MGGYREPSSLNRPICAAIKAAGLDQRVGPQVLRRTFNTLLLAAKVDRIVLRSQMGHCSEEMTERYAGVPVDLKTAAVRRLESGAPEKSGTPSGTPNSDRDPDPGPRKSKSP
jgi:integrase